MAFLLREPHLLREPIQYLDGLDHLCLDWSFFLAVKGFHSICAIVIKSK
jgi:hypothetical protein